MIKRIKNKNKYKFYINGSEITDKKKIKILEEKFKQLRIPPGYTSVKLNPSSKSIFAKCKDAANRDQYMYHPDFVNKQQRLKYCSLIKFGKVLPSIRKQLDRDISANDKKKFLTAVILKIILECSFRVGNERYKNMYNSHGISTISNRHVKGNQIKFIGKKGVENTCVLKNPKVIRILNQLKKKNNKYLFSHQDNRVSSEDINKYLHRFGNFTTKYFRTWAANTNFIKEANNKIMDKKGLSQTIKKVACKLNHTPAVCKKSYLYPDLVEYSQKNKINTSNPSKFLIQFMEKKCN